MLRGAQAVDVLVVGAGVAGLSAALAAARAGAEVVLAAASEPAASHSASALGGMNAVVGAESDWRVHAEDTLRAADFLADQDAVEVLCRDAGPCVEALMRDGLELDRAALGHSGHWRYTLPAVTGSDLVGTLDAALSCERRIGAVVEALVMEDGACVGAVLSDGEVRARSVVLATGGYGHLFSPTVTAPEARGDGIALAYRAGAELMDMEMVQFHPTAVAGTSTLVSERARGAGAVLRNADGEAFMERYAPRARDLAARDVVARAIDAELAEGRGVEPGGVLLDFAGVPAERWPDIAFIRDVVMDEAGIDVQRDPVVVAPAAHYTMGGVRTDADGRTTVPGLLAAGEVACVSVHGANRLGGNSLLEGLVFGARAGRAAAQLSHAGSTRGAATPPDDGKPHAEAAPRGAAERRGEEVAHPAGVAAERRGEAMANPAGVAAVEHAEAEEPSDVAPLLRAAGLRRDGASLDAAIAEVVRLRAAAPADAALELAEVILASARHRTESRGAHFRVDYPARDDARWLCHVVATRGDGGPVLSERTVAVTRWPPGDRAY